MIPDEIIIRQREDGTWEEHKPYTTVEFETEEDFRYFEKILEEHKKMQWIPCSERKPNNDEYDWVLAQVQEDDGFLWIPRVMEYRESKDDWYLDDENPCWLKECHGDKFKVIAWMPLPPVFEGNKE